MQWEHLTGPEFEEAMRQSERVCLLAAGCVEKHGPHLPLGTDFLNGHKVCCLAAEKEPAVVFPPYYFGQIHEGRPFPGTVAISPRLTVELLLEVFDEIGRNGFHKIIIYNAHGGNTHLLNYVIQACLARRKPYAVYLPDRLHTDEQRQAWNALLETKIHAHACECETSISLANHPHLVKMDALGDRKADPLGRFDHLPPGRITARWYSDYPEHYAGDARPASAEKGEKLRAIIVDALADYVRKVKEDDDVPTLLAEFYDRCEEVGK
ncbi:MAG: creatininase family protein [Planctomycetota bacterium]